MKEQEPINPKPKVEGNVTVLPVIEHPGVIGGQTIPMDIARRFSNYNANTGEILKEIKPEAPKE